MVPVKILENVVFAQTRPQPAPKIPRFIYFQPPLAPVLEPAFAKKHPVSEILPLYFWAEYAIMDASLRDLYYTLAGESSPYVE